MKLTLSLNTPNGSDTRVLETGTLTIGRGADNDWTLEDPERVLSKVHCRIDQSGDGFLLTDVSTNGVFVNGDVQPVGRGHSCAIEDGDTLTVGPYVITVAVQTEEPAAGLRFGEGLVAANGPAPSPPYNGIPQLADSPIAGPPEEPWLQTIPGGEFGPGLRAAPIGWDAPPDPSDYGASGQRASELTMPPPSTEFAQESEHLPAISGLLKLPAAQVVLPPNWMETDPLHNVELAPSNIAPPLSETMLAPEPVVPPEPVTPREPPPTEPSPREAEVRPMAPEDFVAGFLEGAGLPATALGADLHEAGRNLGRLVQSAVEGIRDILATRAMVKSELRVDQTIVQAAGNNPMKFAPDVQRCLAAMAGQPPAGFLPGAAAMRQALDDIKVHELALIAALNSVFAELSAQLDPEMIAEKVKGESSLGSVLPVARAARCWTIYEKNYRILQESGAQNTGGSLLSPLAAAYARQVRRSH